MRKSWKLLMACFRHVPFDFRTVICLLSIAYSVGHASPAESSEDQQLEAKTSEGNQQEKQSYKNLLPQIELTDLREKSSERRHGFDDEDRSFSEGTKLRNFASMTDLAKAILDYVEVPNALRDLLTSAKLSVRMQKDSKGWRPVRIDGDPYLRAIFYESWIYLSKGSEFRRVLENLSYSTVRFEVNLIVSSSLAIDEKPQSKIQGNFIVLDLNLKRSTAKEWKLLSAWLANGDPVFGLNVIGLALYVYDAYKSRNRDDPILIRLQQSPAYKAPVRS